MHALDRAALGERRAGPSAAEPHRAGGGEVATRRCHGRARSSGRERSRRCGRAAGHGYFWTATKAESTPESPSFSLAAFGVLVPLERADAHAVDHAAGLLALGEAAFDAQHRQLGALLLGVFAARIGAGLDEVGERAAPVAASVAAGCERAERRRLRRGRCARGRAARPAASAFGGGAGSITVGAASVAGRRPPAATGSPPRRPRTPPARAPGSCRRARCSDPSCGSSRPRRRPARRSRRHLVDERNRHLGHVERDAERHRQADQQADDQADEEPPRWAARRAGCCSCRVGLSCHALRRADAEHARARCGSPGGSPRAGPGARAPAAASSTRKRSAS